MVKLIGIGILAALTGLWLVPAVSGKREADLPSVNVNLPPGKSGQTTSRTGNRTTVTSNLVSYNKTFRLQEEGDPPLRLDEMKVLCHGGLLRMTWYIGNLEPTHPDTGIHLSAYLDGDKVGTLLKGGTRGIWDDAPAHIESVLDCPIGKHRLWVSIDSITGSWGIPYANETDRVQRGFIVEELWRKSR